MPSIPYNASRNALLHPGTADDFFSWGPRQNDTALCAEMSRLAYVREEHRLAGYLQRADFRMVHALGYARDGMQAFVADSATDKLTVVAFRGSEPADPSDLFADARFILSDWTTPSGARLGKVHEGFAAYAHDEPVFRRVKAHLDTLPPATRVLLTGHSLGSALATLMTRWVPTAQLYTFGSPRVGDAAFVQSLKNAVAIRVVNCCDLVTQVPPELVFGYAHAGTLAYIDRRGQWLASPSASTIATDRIEAAAHYLVHHAFLHGTVPSRELADHAPINYVSGVMGVRVPEKR
jgi:Lipase (class 3)